MTWRHGNRGLTMVELLVVLAIISILAAISVAYLIRARHAPHVVACKVNMRGLYLHIQEFERSHGRMPTPEEADLVKAPCPAPGGGVYEYYPNKDENAIILVCKNHMNTSGIVMVCRHDGSLRGIPNDRYDGP